jgi:hypothetical protein
LHFDWFFPIITQRLLKLSASKFAGAFYLTNKISLIRTMKCLQADFFKKLVYGLLATSAVICFCSSTSYAQKFSFGVKGGALVSKTVHNDRDLKSEFASKFKIGGNTSMLINFPLTKPYAWQTEFGYAFMGRRNVQIEPNWENNMGFHYLESAMGLQRFFRLNIKENAVTRGYFSFGPNINYMMGGSGRIITPALTERYRMKFEPSPEEGADPLDNYITNENRWLFGLNFGVGFDMVTQRGQKFITELRYTLGHTNIGQADSSQMKILGFEDNWAANYRVINLSVAYVFDFDLQKAKKGKSTQKIKTPKKRR